MFVSVEFGCGDELCVCHKQTDEPGKNSQPDLKRGFKKSNLFEQEQANGPTRSGRGSSTGIMVGYAVSLFTRASCSVPRKQLLQIDKVPTALFSCIASDVQLMIFAPGYSCLPWLAALPLLWP